ncbi:MAG: tartrate-resistant acid phosphatase type 5, partial [Kiritimatiellia bacterium]
MRPVLLFMLATTGCVDPVYSDTDVGTGSDSDSATETETETETSPPPVVTRFVALGDGGEGNFEQAEVAKIMKQVCDRDGCDFALYLGDNFYDDGVDGIDDIQWYDKFEKPYSGLTFPFYAALGNHDNGGFGGAGFEFWKGDVQVEYAASGKSDKFRMPDRYY